MEYAVDTDHAEDDVAGVGCDFDDDLAASVECAEDLLNLLLLIVFHGDDDFFDMMLFNEFFELF